MRNNPVSSLMKVISKLMKRPIKEMLAADLLGSITSVAIYTYRANYSVKMNGRKWLAPLYRPYLSTFQIRKGVFITVREGRRTVDIDIGSDTYTSSAQEWREKQGYFLLIPPNRVKGRLGTTVKQILIARKLSHGKQ